MQEGKLTLWHKNEDREIWGVSVEDNSFYEQRFFVLRPAKIGGHWHAVREKVFTILHGTGQALIQPLDERGNAKGKRQVIPVEGNSVIVVHPYEAHGFVFDGPAEMLCYSTTAQRNPDPDTMLWKQIFD